MRLAIYPIVANLLAAALLADCYFRVGDSCFARLVIFLIRSL
jgi:hypothetical protein